MEVRSLAWKKLDQRKNNFLLPNSIRGIIVGKSGCGKTILLMNLLLIPGWLDYDNLQVFGKSLFQLEYKILQKGLEEKIPKEYILNLFYNQEKINQPLQVLEYMSEEIPDKEKSKIKSSFCESSEDVPDPRDLNSSERNLIIFDDLQLEKQNMPEKYYIRGRHSNVDCFYLAQNYFKLPRQTIRENANFICLFPQDGKSIDHIYRDHVSSDMSREEFRDLCRKAWKDPYSFLVIDLSSKVNEGRYRKKFDEFYIK